MLKKNKDDIYEITGKRDIGSFIDKRNLGEDICKMHYCKIAMSKREVMKVAKQLHEDLDGFAETSDTLEYLFPEFTKVMPEDFPETMEEGEDIDGDRDEWVRTEVTSYNVVVWQPFYSQWLVAISEEHWVDGDLA
jgi:hypothetical protein